MLVGSADLRLRLLGEFEALSAGAALHLGGRQQRAVLLVLALEADRTVPIDRLVDRLWGDCPPASAIATVQAYVSRLRGRLPGAEQTLISTAGGYRLSVDPQNVDSVVFESLADRGRAALAAGRPQNASRDFAEALGLWRGPCLPEFADHGAAQGAIDRLEGLRLLTTEDALEADLLLGHHHSCAARAEQLVGDHPLRERAWAILSLALYRSGRQADALAALRAVRSLLDDELGVQPTPMLRQLEHLILRQDAALDTATGLPWTAVTQPVVRQVSPVPANRGIAKPGPAFVGRSDEMRTLRQLLEAVMSGPEGGRVALVEGEPGAGKTTLARHLADDARRAGALVAWASCGDAARSPALWPWICALRQLDGYGGGSGHADETLHALLSSPVAHHATLATPGQAFVVREALVAQLSRLAVERPMLLVVDDAHLADQATLDVLAALAPHVPELCLLLLLTHRGGPREAIAPETLATLARHVPTISLVLGGLHESDVMTLAGQFAGVTPRLARAVAERTAGNPFFVGELLRAAAEANRAPVTGGSDTATSRAFALTSLVPPAVTDVVRARLLDLPAVTHELLATAAILGVVSSLADLAAAAGLPREVCAQHLEAAVERGVLVPTDDTARSLRFSHAIVRDTVLADLSALHRVRLHARCARALRRRHGLTADHAEPIAYHVLAAQGLVTTADAVPAVTAAADVAASRGAHTRAEELLAAATELADDEPRSEERDSMLLRILLRRIRLRLVVRGLGVTELPELVARAVVLSDATDSFTDLCEALCAAAVTAVSAGDADGARGLARRAIELAERSGDAGLEHDAHQAAARVAFNTGRLRDASAELDICLRLLDDNELRDTDAPGAVTPRWFTVGLAGFTAAITGQEERARELGSQCMARALAIDDPVALQTAGYFSAWAAAWAGDLPEALRFVDDCLAQHTDHVSPYFRFASGVLRAWLVSELGDPTDGLRDIDAALDGMTSLGALPWVSYAYAMRAEVLLRGGDVTGAARAMTDALQHTPPHGDPYEAEILRIRAEIQAADDATAGATALLRDALVKARAQGADAFARRLHAVLSRLAEE